MNKLKNFWKDGFSIDETKTSILIFLTFAGVVTAIVLYILNRTLGPEFVKLLQTLIIAIAGVNAASSLATLLKDNIEDEDIKKLIDELLPSAVEGYIAEQIASAEKPEKTDPL